MNITSQTGFTNAATAASALEEEINAILLDARSDIMMQVPPNRSGVLVSRFEASHDGPTAHMSIDPSLSPESVRTIGRMLKHSPSLPEGTRIILAGDYDEVTTESLADDRMTFEILG